MTIQCFEQCKMRTVYNNSHRNPTKFFFIFAMMVFQSMRNTNCTSILMTTQGVFIFKGEMWVVFIPASCICPKSGTSQLYKQPQRIIEWHRIYNEFDRHYMGVKYLFIWILELLNVLYFFIPKQTHKISKNNQKTATIIVVHAKTHTSSCNTANYYLLSLSY